jgi:hypothetical protein
MRNTLLFFICTIAAVYCNAQLTIRGKVVDNTTDLPVSNASVYINNTSIGTVTNDKGTFILTASNIYSGELIISSVGYQVLSFKLNDTDASTNFYTIKLDVKENVLKEVLILNDVARQNWMKILKENFLGITEEADNCILQNPGAVYFAKGENKNSLYAYADTPLVIINKLLGYKISFYLAEFSYDKIRNSTYFIGYSRYQDICEKRSCIKRRQQNYFGSTMHFYRSLISNNLKKQGYSIQEVKTIKAAADSTNKTNQVGKIGDYTVLLPIDAANILITDTVPGTYYLHGVENIQVDYNHVPSTGYYLSKKTFVKGLMHYGFKSFIGLLADNIGLDANGIVHTPMSVIYDGFWGYEKLANQLPFNYMPQ